MGYAPTALVLSLILATPLPWRQRGYALIWGFAISQVYVAIRLVIWMLSASIGAEFGWITPGASLHTVFRVVYTVITNSMAGAYIIPIFLWMAVIVAGNDLSVLLNRKTKQDNQ